jgi:phosphoglycolate phosphatase
MAAMAARALVFDLDGTIWDSLPWLARVVGGKNPRNERAALESLRGGIPAARLLKAAKVDARRFRSICQEARDFHPYDGVVTTLEHVQALGRPLGVVTNLPAWIARPMLGCVGLDDCFDSVVDFGRTRRHKPWPDPLELALSELGEEPGPDVWYVGDVDADAVAAERAGLSFAWATYGYGEREPQYASTSISAFADVANL